MQEPSPFVECANRSLPCCLIRKTGFSGKPLASQGNVVVVELISTAATCCGYGTACVARIKVSMSRGASAGDWRDRNAVRFCFAGCRPPRETTRIYRKGGQDVIVSNLPRTLLCRPNIMVARVNRLRRKRCSSHAFSCQRSMFDIQYKREGSYFVETPIQPIKSNHWRPSLW